MTWSNGLRRRRPLYGAAMDDSEAFCRALWKREPKTIATLVGRVDPNGKDRFGYTPLLMAAQYGDLALVSQLMRRGADIDQGRIHLTPITFAARRQVADVVAFLRSAGATVSIVTAIHLGDRAQVERELRRDPAQATLRDEGRTPIIHHAVEALRSEIVALLLEHGATLDDTDANGETPLHRLADLRQAPQDAARAMAAFLISRGAEVDVRNWDDVTPLHQAVRARNLAVTEVLLGHGADANARDKSRGSTPLRRAVSGTGAGNTAGTADLMVPLTRILLAHGADPDARDKRGVTVRASARAPAVVAVLDAHRRAAKKMPASVRAKKSVSAKKRAAKRPTAKTIRR